MSRLGVEINSDNEATNEIIQAQYGEQDQGDGATIPDDAEMNAMLADRVETEKSWDPETQQSRKPRRAALFGKSEEHSGSETTEDRRSRLRKESIFAHARM